MQKPKIKTEHRIKAYSCSARRGRETIPQIRIQVKRLAEFGFTSGTKMKETSNADKLILEVMQNEEGFER